MAQISFSLGLYVFLRTFCDKFAKPFGIFDLNFKQIWLNIKGFIFCVLFLTNEFTNEKKT